MLSQSVVSDWDLSSAKTHSVWFQDLMKLRFLRSHCRKIQRDTVIGKRIQRQAQSTEHVPSQRVYPAAMKCVVSFCELDDFIF